MTETKRSKSARRAARLRAAAANLGSAVIVDVPEETEPDPQGTGHVPAQRGDASA